MTLLAALAGSAVGRIGLGCWRLSGPDRPDRDAALATLATAYEAGYRLFDTADSYCLTEDEHGYGETLLAEALAGRPDAVIVTKGGWARPGGEWELRGSPDWLRRAVHDSAERLGRVPDVYLLHEPDPRYPVEDSMGALWRALDEGLVGSVGISNVSVADLGRLLDDGPIDVVQNRLSVTVRPRGTGHVLELCRARGTAFMAYSPMGPTLDEGGLGSVGADPAVAAVAARHGASPYAVALAWLMAQGEHVVPIPGARRAASVLDSATAAGLRLGPDDLELLDAPMDGAARER